MEKTRDKVSRRKFLKAGAVVAGATAATVAMPNVSRAQTVTLKMQGAWGANDIFNEFAADYVKRVNDLGGGRMKIDYLVEGAVVKAFQVMDAVHRGVLDAGHQVTVYWYGKNKVASLFGTGPVWGQNAHHILAWIHYGGGKELYDEVLKTLGLNVVGFFCMPMPTQPLGWFKKPITAGPDMNGLKYRTVGLAADVYQEMGVKVTQLPGGEIVPALEKGVIDAFEYNNPTSDMRFGAADVAKVYMMGSHHQAAEFFEILFNKDKFNALAPEQKKILEYAAEAASTNNFSKALDNYSRDLLELKKKGVQIVRTPKAVFEDQLKAWDKVTAKLMQDPLFKKVAESQKAWSHRVAYYELLNAADYKSAFDHHFPGELGF